MIALISDEPRYVLVRDCVVIAAGPRDFVQQYKQLHGGELLTWEDWLLAYNPNEQDRIAALCDIT